MLIVEIKTTCMLKVQTNAIPLKGPETLLEKQALKSVCT